jgi:hypothetical protein
MQLERLGVIVFFGMIVPGAFLTASILLAFACLLEVNGIRGHAEIFSFVGKNLVLTTTAFFFLSYLLGVVLRLFAPNVVDKASSFYLRFFRRKKKKDPKNAWVFEPFPYKNSLASHMRKQGMAEVTAFIESLDKEYGNPGNTTFFAYCKLLIEANSDSLAKHIQQSEALVRFLSGTSLALIVSVVLGTTFSIIFGFQHKTLLLQLYTGVSLVSLLTLAGILARFKFQRRREVLLLWNSVYLLLKGSIPNTLGISPSELTNRVRLSSSGESGFSENPSSVPSGEPVSQKVADPVRASKGAKEDSENEGWGTSPDSQEDS